MSEPILQLTGITKSFGGTRALVDGALKLFAGQVTALLGENGAGKSTLVKVLTGIHQPDSGDIIIDGRSVEISSPQAAQQLGISVIHQESVVFDDLSIAENIFIGVPPMRHRMIDWRAMGKRASVILQQLESTLNPTTLVRELSVAQKHLVQIARALSHDARVVVMDEPTAALSKNEADDLLNIVDRLRAEGRAVLYISHKLEEVTAIADRYSVFRDGAAVGDGLMAMTTLDELIKLMVGREVDQVFPRSTASVRSEIATEVLRVEHLCREPEFSDISFNINRGEILGVYGLVGAGRSDVMRTVFGLSKADSGQIVMGGKTMQFAHPDAAINAGIAYVPEDRQAQGAMILRSIAENMLLPNLDSCSRYGLLRSSQQTATANEWAARLGIKCANTQQAVQELSGGNQQKVVLAKWLLTNPKVLILDEPTKGIDIGAKATVHQLIGELAAQGMAVIMVSSELPEILGMADRIVVMCRGRLAGTFVRNQISAEEILRVASASNHSVINA